MPITPDGKSANNGAGAAAASGIKVGISYGQSSSESVSTSQSASGKGSRVKAGGKVNIKATEGDITVQGSEVQAGEDLLLDAKQRINLLASTDSASERSTNKSQSASVGASIGMSSSGISVSLDLAASQGRGRANSDSVTSNNSLVQAGRRVQLRSGSDTNIAGAQVQGQTVKADIGGDLNVASLQDRANSAARQNTSGFGLSIPVYGAGSVSGSVSNAQQKSNSNYQSVFQQSGIAAGDGGFDIKVSGNTDLKGAAITSTAAASDNHLVTQTLSTSDLQNSSQASASSSGISLGTDMLAGKYAVAKSVMGNALNRGQVDSSDNSTTHSVISAAQVTVGNKTTDTSQAELKDSQGKTITTDTSNAHRALQKADVAGLQELAQEKQADKMLAFKTASAFNDEAYRTMYKAGAKMYRVPPGCSDQSCAVPLTEKEAMNLKTSEDGKIHLSNNGIFNDLDGAVKYAQQHGGTMNPDGSKDYSNKPEYQYIIFAPQANNFLSELIVAGVQKSGLTPVLGLTNPEEQTAKVIKQTTLQGKSLAIDSHSRGSWTTTNAEIYLNNQGGIKDADGNTITPKIQMNNIGAAQNTQTGNTVLQQLTGDKNAQINAIIHPKDPVGKSVIVGNNPTTPTYTSTTKDGVKQEVTAKDDGRSVLSNLGNILFGSATPHNCYGTSRTTPGCDQQWEKNTIPKSNAKKIEPNPSYKAPVVIPQYQINEDQFSQILKDTNSDMKKLLPSTKGAK